VDFPLFKTFKIDISIVDFLNRKFEEYARSMPLYQADNRVYISETGQFTSNLLQWDDEEYGRFVKDQLIQIVSTELRINQDSFSLYYNHFFDYNQGGYVNPHEHSEFEDFVLIFYLNDVKCGGETCFYLNSHPNHRYRTSFKITPTKSLVVGFSSGLFHSVEWTDEPKRVFVVGVRVDLKNMR